MNIIYRVHAIERMFEREISEDIVENVLENGEIIEKYLDDKPYPSFLILGYDDTRPIHVVYAQNSETLIVITVYEPDKLKWESDYKKRI